MSQPYRRGSSSGESQQASGKKRQRAAALQDLSGFARSQRFAKRLGVRLPSAAFAVVKIFACFVFFCGNFLPSTMVAQEKITYDDQVTPILRNNCFKCHNPDKTKGDLDLTTYSGVLKGGGSGKAVMPGDAPGSKLYKAIARTEEPFMPANGPKLPDADIELVRKWIAGGLLEKSSSQALAANKPKLSLMSNSAAQGRKPDGPTILPIEWLLEPAQHTERTNVVTALAASPWSPLIALGGQHQLLIYHSGTLELLGVLPFPEGNPSCVQFSRDSRLLVVAGGRGAKFGFVDLYDVATGERVTRVGNEYDTVLAADLNSDQTHVALGGPGKHVKIFSTRDARLAHDLKKHTDWVTAIQYSPDSVLLATGDRNGGLVVWEADSGQELYTLAGHTAAITALSWRDDSDLLLSASEDGTIRVWEMKEGRQVANWAAHKDGVLDARFAHDTRIVSCGRDKQIAIWDAGGSKQRNWDAGDLPVRASFSHDGSNVLASSWQGRVGVWLAADGKPKGEITPNPLTLAERLDLAKKAADSRQTAATKSEQDLASATAAAGKIETAMAAYDQTTSSFQFVAATRQAQAAHRKAADEAGKGLEKLKTVAAKSAAPLAAAEAESAKIQAALDKMDKFTAPYKELAKQVDAAGQKIAALTAASSNKSKALADKTAAVNAAAAELAAKASAAAEARDKAGVALGAANKQSEAAVQTVAQARAAADSYKLKVAQQQAAASQALALVTSSESEVANINQALTATNKDSAEGRQLTTQLEAAARQFASARIAHESTQKAFEDLKTAGDKSAALVIAADAEVVKLKPSVETARKALDAAKDALALSETAKAVAAEAAKKETEALQAAVTEAAAALTGAKAENADLQAKLDKTEKFSDAFKDMTRQLDAANKRVSEARVPADHDRKEVAELQAALDKITAAAASAQSEADKAIAALARNDPAFRQFQELEKQLASAKQKVAEAKAIAVQARKDAGASRLAVVQIRAAQANVVLHQARETLAPLQAQHETHLRAIAAAEEELRAARAEIQNINKAADQARAALYRAAHTPTRRSEPETAPTLEASKQKNSGTPASQVLAASNSVTNARTRLSELGRQIQSLNESIHSSRARLLAAQVAAADGAPRLEAEKARVEKLAAQYRSLTGTASASTEVVVKN
jgi:hypothetical protein